MEDINWFEGEEAITPRSEYECENCGVEDPADCHCDWADNTPTPAPAPMANWPVGWRSWWTDWLGG